MVLLLGVGSDDLVDLLPLGHVQDQRPELGCRFHDPATSSAAALRASTSLKRRFPRSSSKAPIRATAIVCRAWV